METSDAAAEEAKQSEKEPEIVTEEDENRKIIVAEALKKFDELKNFIEVNRSAHLNMIFNELIENGAQKEKKTVILEVSLDLKIYLIYTVYSYHMKKSSILISIVFFWTKSPKLYIADTCYSGHFF